MMYDAFLFNSETCETGLGKRKANMMITSLVQNHSEFQNSERVYSHLRFIRRELLRELFAK